MTAERFCWLLGGFLCAFFSINLFKNPFLQIALMIVLSGLLALLITMNKEFLQRKIAVSTAILVAAVTLIASFFLYMYLKGTV